MLLCPLDLLKHNGLKPHVLETICFLLHVNSPEEGNSFRNVASCLTLTLEEFLINISVKAYVKPLLKM